MSFKPPQSAINNAKRGLKLRQEWGRGGLSPAEAKAQGIDSGVTRARKIASGTVSEHDVRRMSAFTDTARTTDPIRYLQSSGVIGDALLTTMAIGAVLFGVIMVLTSANQKPMCQPNMKPNTKPCVKMKSVN